MSDPKACISCRRTLISSCRALDSALPWQQYMAATIWRRVRNLGEGTPTQTGGVDLYLI